MKKLAKRFYAILLTVIMILTMVPMTAFAEDGKQSITINGTEEGSVDLFGRTFNVYQVFTAGRSGGAFVDYAVAPAFEKFFKDIAGDAENFDAVAYVEGLKKEDGSYDTAQVQEFAKQLAHYVREQKIEPTGIIKPEKAENSDKLKKGSNQLTGLDYGYYFIDEPKAVAGSAAMLGALRKDLNAVFTVKSEKPTVEKKIVEQINGEDVNKDVTDAKIGDTITFTLTSRIPDNAANFENEYIFVFHDTLSKGLTFNEDSVKVTIDGTETEAFITATDKEDNKFTVKIDSDFAKANAGKAIIVTYTAELNEGAVIGGSGNPNEVTVEYSNNPYWDGTGEPTTNETTKDTVVVFTFQGNGTKVDGANENVLGGAEFELYTSEAMNDESRIYVKSGEQDGIYITTKEETETKITSISKDENKGKFVIKGLEEGTYFLKETKAPDGYNLLKNPIKLVVTPVYDEDANGKPIIKILNVSFVDSPAELIGTSPADGTFDYKVKNTSGPILPETGGIGTYLFTFGGLILMIAAAVLLIYSKKKSAHK